MHKCNEIENTIINYYNFPISFTYDEILIISWVLLFVLYLNHRVTCAQFYLEHQHYLERKLELCTDRHRWTLLFTCGETVNTCFANHCLLLFKINAPQSTPLPSVPLGLDITCSYSGLDALNASEG